MSKTYRVVAWSTGNVGRHVIAGIDARTDLELVGLWVSNPDKVGKDAGELAGLDRTLGVAAVQRARQVQWLSVDLDRGVRAPPRHPQTQGEFGARLQVQANADRPVPGIVGVDP